MQVSPHVESVQLDLEPGDSSFLLDMPAYSAACFDLQLSLASVAPS